MDNRFGGGSNVAMEAVTAYRSKSHCLSDSDTSDSDSDTDCWKRNKQNLTIKQQSLSEAQSCTSVFSNGPNIVNNERKRKVNNIWSSVIEEQTVTDVLGKCGLRRKPITLQDRSCESYDFRQKFFDTRNVPVDGESMDIDGGYRNDNVKRSVYDVKKGKFPKLKKQDLLVAKKIIYKLNEKKHYLVYRIVHVIGAEKAMALLKMTEDVEEQGGMLVKNNSRRRTPGGVYIQLLKDDKSLSKEQKEEIFAEETFTSFKKHPSVKKKKKDSSKKKGKKPKEIPGSMDVTDISSDRNTHLPPSAVTPACEDEKNGESEIEDGEIFD